MTSSRMDNSLEYRTRLPEDVHGLRKDPPPAQVCALSLRVPVTDVALLVLEVPRVDDEEAPLPDPHPLLQLPRDPPEAGLPVRAHHADPGRAEELVRDPEDLPLAVRGEADADDLFLGHSLAHSPRSYKGFRSSGRVPPSPSERPCPRSSVARLRKHTSSGVPTFPNTDRAMANGGGGTTLQSSAFVVVRLRV